MIPSQYITAIGRVLLVLSVTALIWVGLIHVFAATHSPPAVAHQPHPSQPVAQIARSFHASVFTSDRKFIVTLDVAPDCAGPNVFTVSVFDSGTGMPSSIEGISLSTTMLDMKMGTQMVPVHPDGKGQFSAHGNLGMGGDWSIGIQLRTLDKALHEAIVNVLTPC